MAIDFHTHAFPDSLAKRAIATLEAGCPWKAVGTGTVAGLLESMDRAGIEISVICPIATKPEQVGGILEWCRGIRSPRIIPLPSVHPDTQDIPRWMEQFAAQGYKGVKIHPQYQGFAADEPRMDAIYASAVEFNLLISSHCGLDIAFAPEDDRAAPQRFARVLDRFPTLRLVCTHMGGWRAWDEAQQHILGRDVYLETSFSLDELGPQRARQMIERHGWQRVLFGTDWPWNAQASQQALIQAFGLPPAQTQAILHDNAARLLGLAPQTPVPTGED